MRYQILFVSILASLFLVTGCSTLSAWMGFPDQKDKQAQTTQPAEAPVARFSVNPNMPVTTNRQYHRMTRKMMEDESDVGAQAGSMWVMEGQGAYLFAQNKSRKEGDLLNVKIEGQAQKQIETKVAVIKKLLKQLEDEERKATEPMSPRLDTGPSLRAPASAPIVSADTDKNEEAKIEFVPTKIVERHADGNYRIKGQQPFMIGKREYKLIVTGIIRAEDFNDEGTSSAKLLDPQYEVVSLRRKEL